MIEIYQIPCDFRGDVDMYDVHVTRTGTEQANPLAIVKAREHGLNAWQADDEAALPGGIRMHRWATPRRPIASRSHRKLTDTAM